MSREATVPAAVAAAATADAAADVAPQPGNAPADDSPDVAEDIDHIPTPDVHVLGFYHSYEKGNAIKIANNSLMNPNGFNSQQFLFQIKMEDKFQAHKVLAIALRAFKLFVETHLTEQLAAHSLVTVIVPSSKTENPLNHALLWIAQQLEIDLHVPFVKALVRAYSIEKATNGGCRKVSTRYNSLALGTDIDLEGKHVILLDDTATTGNSFTAGLLRLRDIKADVFDHATCLAILQTCWTHDSKHGQATCEEGKKPHVRVHSVAQLAEQKAKAVNE